MANYWINRAIQDEEKAQALAASYIERQQEAYIKAYQQIEQRVDALYSQIISSPYGLENITRSQLWQYKKYIDLRNEIAQQVEGIGRVQNDIIEMCIQDVFEKTMGFDVAEVGSSFTTIGNEQLRQVLNSNWSGDNYSDRIWKNTNNLAERLNKDIADLICNGRNPEDLKEMIMQDFNTSYNVADRLIRTEASYAYNTAAIESYKAAGVEQVEFIAENDCCEECEQYRGQAFPVAQAPLIPVHPNCRCCYAPIVELEI